MNLRTNIAVVVVLCCACAHGGGAGLAAGEPVPSLRLPANARPLSQAVTLTLSPDAEVFTGSIDIDVEITAPARVLWLNQNDLQISRALVRAGGVEQVATVLAQPKDLVGLQLQTELTPGKASVHIDYSGKIAAKEGRGIYHQREGADWYLLTQFESIDARRAFPCFDEPTYKAPWQITLRVPIGMPAFSNTSPESDSEEGGKRVVRFAPTLPLPSYLVAFAVGPFEVVEAGRAELSKAPVRILALKGMSERAHYSAAASPKLLSLLEEWFGIPYAYPKMDSIAVPLGGGAMENPGLVTFAQNLLLARPGEETANFRHVSAEVAAHEFAHQWFGDWVTTAWWDDIWLNEAFATWMAPKVLERFAPEWDVPAMHAEIRATALAADSLVSARAIRQPIASDDDIFNAFDGITYQKGASVIRMFESWLGPEQFRAGVQKYLRAHANGNGTAVEFLSAIAAEGGEKGAALPAAFSTFLDQPGAPLITARLSCEPGAPARLLLQQERYLRLGSPTAAAQRWQVPVCARWGAGDAAAQHGCTLLTEEKGALELGATCPAWVLPNEGMTGYYRADAGAQMLATLLGGDKLSATERAGLTYDARALVAAGKAPVGEVLALLPLLARDRDRTVSLLMVDLLSDLQPGQLVPEDLRPQVALFVEKTVGERARGLGLEAKEGEDDETRLLRPELVEIAADLGEDAELRTAARALAQRWLAERRSVQPDAASLALQISALAGDRAWFDQLLAAAKAAKERDERRRLLGALGQFRTDELRAAALALTLSDQFEARESVAILIGVARQDGRGARLVLDFFEKNYDALVARLPVGTAAFFPRLAGRLCSNEAAAEVELFFSERSRKVDGGPRALRQALESLHSCAAYRQANRASAEEFLRGSSGKATASAP